MTLWRELLFPSSEKFSPEAAEASALLQGLCKHLIFADVIVADGATGETHGLLKVVLPDLRYWVILFHFLNINKKTEKKNVINR